MILLDLTLSTAEQNLALDEALLAECDRAGDDAHRARDAEALRFWESPTYFVVLGVAGQHAVEADVDACARDGIPVLRRISGGGTVVQGPGCLSYSLVLSLEDRPEIREIKRSYAHILDRVRRALELTGTAVLGTSDIALEDQKISGNAQKRTRRALLHHGTVLHGFDVERMARWLRPPVRQPEYRRRRPHDRFVRNVPLSVEEIKARMAKEWNAVPPGISWRAPPLDALIEEKYGNDAWNRRF